MSNYIFRKTIAILAILYFAASGPASADDDFDSSLPTSLLDGTTIVYSYIDGHGTAYRVSFEDGLFDWESVEFRFEDGARSRKSKDSSIKGSPYKAHKLNHGEYMMYFIEDAPEPDGRARGHPCTSISTQIRFSLPRCSSMAKIVKPRTRFTGRLVLSTASHVITDSSQKTYSKFPLKK